MKGLTQGLEQMGIPLDAPKLKKLQTYMDELEFWNPKYGLIKVENREELVIRHILDSLAGLKHIASSRAASIADLGSGSGLPGIPLALFLEETPITLVERSGKRCRFLENMCVLLELSNVTVLNLDLKQLDSRFDLITFRAFRPFEPQILQGILKVLEPHGILAAYKGKEDNCKQELTGLQAYFKTGRIIPLNVPFLKAERNLLWMEGPLTV